MTLVDIKSLKVSFAQHGGMIEAVRGVSLHVNDGESLGIVEGFSHNTAQVLLEVRSSTGSRGMIPYVSPLVKEINQIAKRIIVDLPEGLFESDREDE